MADHDQTESSAVGILTDVVMGDELVQYVERIDATLAPIGGAFLVHGDEPLVHEGTSPGSVILVESRPLLVPWTGTGQRTTRRWSRCGPTTRTARSSL